MVSELKEKTEKLRERLLDLSRKNNFINFSHKANSKNPNKQRFFRIVNEIPELLINKLTKGNRYRLIPKSKQANFDFNLPYLTAKTSTLARSNTKTIQVFEENPKFGISCNFIRTESNSFEKDKGINVLHVAIGFIKYPVNKGVINTKKPKDPNKKQRKVPTESYAPLILYPVKLTREKTASGFNYFLETDEDELILNRSLKAKLMKEEGITLPDLEYDKDNNPLIEQYFKKINFSLIERNEIEKENKWELKRWCTAGIFKFGKLAIFDDINFDSWGKNPLLGKELVQDFINGVPSNSNNDEDDKEIVQDKFEKNQLIDQIPKLIAEADSTQYKVIIKALEGKSMAIEGPPGTGKSQTITNIIGGLMVKNKKILFAADKFAALEVVKQRLSSKNLGDYILELHNATKSKKVFHEELVQRLGKSQSRFFKPGYSDSFDKLRLFRKELNDHVETINKEMNVNGERTTVFELLWKDIVNKLNLSEKLDEIKNFEDSFPDNILRSIEKEKIPLVRSNLELLFDVYKSIQDLDTEQLNSINGLPETEDELEKLIRVSSRAKSLLEKLEINLQQKNIDFKELLNLNDEKLKNDINIFENLIAIKNINKDFILKEDLADKLSKIYKLVVDRESIDKEIEDWAKPFLDNEDKFDRLENSLNEINNLEASDQGLKINEILDQLAFLFEFSRFFTRKIGREDKRLNSSTSLKNLLGLIDSFKKIKNKYDHVYNDLIFLILKTNDHIDLMQVLSKIKLIQRNNNLCEKLKKEGLDVKKIIDIGSDKLLNYIDIIKNAPFLGCLLDKEVRVVKKSWKSLSCEGYKRPSLRKMAKIYSISAEYCDCLNKEKSIESLSLDIQELRDISFKIDLDENLETLLKEIKSNFEDKNQIEIIFKILEENINNNDFPKGTIPLIKNIEALNLNEVENLSNVAATNIFSKLSLLGDKAKDSLLDTKFKNIRFILEDLKSLKRILSELSISIKETNIYCNVSMEYNLKTNDIKLLLDLFGKVNLSNYNSITKENIIEKSLTQILSNLKILKNLINDLEEIDENLNEDIIYSFLDKNIENDKEFLSDFKKLNLVLDNLLKLKTNIEKIIESKRIRKNISQYGLEKGVDEFLEVSSKTSVDIKDLFNYFYIKNQIKETSLEKKINNFTGKSLNACREQFCELDKTFIENTCNYVDKYLDKNLSSLLIPSKTISRSPKDLTEGDLITHEVNKKRNHLPYRKLFKQSINSLQRLKPCFMMSPSSAAQCLPKKSDIFDVLIIDEASQMNPEEAIGLIARCKQVIIVGDQKQLPPDNRWMKSMDDEGDDEQEIELEINESILELANKVLNTRDCSLGWHYRSRHNSLINFSNKFFYNNNLTVFPSNKIGSEINLIKVENSQYQKSINRPEILKVIETFKAQIKDDPSKTILIATMNKDQADEIQIELDKETNKDQNIADYLSRHNGELEKLLIKNLENVQGDERDIVIISTVYGPDPDGKVSNNFGDVSKAQGDRRLNVLLTRAKDKIFLVTSLNSSDVRPNPAAVTGSKYLKEYLQYAETGKIADTTVRSGGQPENVFEEGILNALIKRGYEVDAQIGCLNYSIDLAIKDPRDKSRYILAVECDGASYHRGYSARVSDRLRQQVLENLGWNVFRIWSTDWWRNPELELDLLDEKVNQLKAENNEEKSFNVNDSQRDVNVVLED